MFYGLIYIFQALFKMHVDITNQKAAVVGNVSYNGKVMEQQILQDYNTVSGENKYSTITVFFSFIHHTPPPIFSTFLKVPGCIKCNLQYYNLVKFAAPSLSRCKIHYQLQQPSGL
jgi:hypothetical protein